MRKGTSVAACIAVCLVTTTTAVAAYGPVAPPGLAVPGGFSIIVASKTIGPAGGVVKGTTGRTTIQLTVRPQTLARPVQFTLTRPRLSQLSRYVPKGWRLTTGFALLTNQVNGVPISSRFSSTPAGIVISDPRINQNTVIGAWNPSVARFTLVSARVQNGRAVVATRQFAEYLVYFAP
jgi:hypothetical protein